MRTKESLRQAIFLNYYKTQGRVGGHLYSDLTERFSYYENNYARHISSLDLSAEIVEIGCGPGSLLKWFKQKGYKNLEGYDMSPLDVDFANKSLGSEVAKVGDGFDLIGQCTNKFDLIITKAVVEHIDKKDLLALFENCYKALRKGGVLIVDVPNMDWIVSGHERYMDLTHENGFTRESLGTILKLFFEQNEIYGSQNEFSGIKRQISRFAIFLFRQFLRCLGEGASSVLFESRSIISVSRK